MEVVVEVRGGRITNVTVPKGLTVHIFDYDTQGVPKDNLEPDEKGRPCQQTIWSRPGETMKKMRVTVEKGQVTRVGLSQGVECLVKTYGSGKEPTTKRWMVKK